MGLARALFRVIAIGIAVGGLIYCLAWSTRNYLFFGDLADEAYGSSLAARVGLDASERLHLPLIYVAIDGDIDSSAKRLRLVTPPISIVTILGKLAAAHPKLVVLDIDLAPGDTLYPNRLNGSLVAWQKSNIPLLLVRKVERTSSSTNLWYLPGTTYDDLVQRSKNIQWVSAVAVSRHGVVEEFLPWVRTCHAGQAAYLLNAAFAASAIVRAADPRAHAFLPKPAWSCSPFPHNSGAQVSSTKLATASGFEIVSEASQRIRYTLPWPGTHYSSGLMITAANSTRRPLLTTFSALTFLQRRSNVAHEFGDLFAGSIVIVGSAPQWPNSDWVDTPLGDMPGSFVLLNYVRALLDFGLGAEQPFWYGLMVIVLVSAATALSVAFFENWTSLWGGLLLPTFFGTVWLVCLGFALLSNAYFALGLTQIMVTVVTVVASLAKNQDLAHR